MVPIDPFRHRESEDVNKGVGLYIAGVRLDVLPDYLGCAVRVEFWALVVGQDDIACLPLLGGGHCEEGGRVHTICKD